MRKIGELAHELGLNPQTIYFYERLGLISSSQRTNTGYRLFNDQDVTRLSFILRLKELGMSLEEIKEILCLKDAHCLTCEKVKDRLENTIKHIDDQITTLQTLRAELLPLLDRCLIRLETSTPHTQCKVFDELILPKEPCQV